mgnify:CR=1 FL=1
MIAFINNYPTPHKIYLFNLLYEKLKDEIIFFFTDFSSPKRESWKKYRNEINFPYEIIESYRILNKSSKDIGSILILKKMPELKKFKKVVISGGLNILEFQIAKSLLNLKIPYLLWIESFNLGEGNSLFLPLRYLVRKFLFTNAICVICGSKMSLKHAKSFGSKNTILNWTSFNIYKFNYNKSHTGNFLRMLFVGRLIKRKRIFDILKALKGLDEYKLDIVGSGYLDNELKKYIEKNKLCVEFKGEIDYEEMSEIYKNYDILILPAENEVFGYVVIEAIMSSLAVIVSNQVGAKDFVREDFHFKVGDIKSLRQKILKLRDHNLRNELVNYSKELVLRYAKPEDWVSRFINALKD